LYIEAVAPLFRGICEACRLCDILSQPCLSAWHYCLNVIEVLCYFRTDDAGYDIVFCDIVCINGVLVSCGELDICVFSLYLLYLCFHDLSCTVAPLYSCMIVMIIDGLYMSSAHSQMQCYYNYCVNFSYT